MEQTSYTTARKILAPLVLTIFGTVAVIVITASIFTPLVSVVVGVIIGIISTAVLYAVVNKTISNG